MFQKLLIHATCQRKYNPRDDGINALVLDLGKQVTETESHLKSKGEGRRMVGESKSEAKGDAQNAGDCDF
jgi:hypothetical protein